MVAGGFAGVGGCFGVIGAGRGLEEIGSSFAPVFAPVFGVFLVVSGWSGRCPVGCWTWRRWFPGASRLPVGGMVGWLYGCYRSWLQGGVLQVVLVVSGRV